jgi:hypothetical protein
MKQICLAKNGWDVMSARGGKGSLEIGDKKADKKNFGQIGDQKIRKNHKIQNKSVRGVNMKKI